MSLERAAALLIIGAFIGWFIPVIARAIVLLIEKIKEDHE